MPGSQVINLGTAEIDSRAESGNEDPNFQGLNVSQEFDQQFLDEQQDNMPVADDMMMDEANADEFNPH